VVSGCTITDFMLKLLSRRGYCFNTSSLRLVVEGSPQAQPQLNPLTYVVTQDAGRYERNDDRVRQGGNQLVLTPKRTPHRNDIDPGL
jgi:hypothetical protein